MGFNLLRGRVAERFGPRFPDMSQRPPSEPRTLARAVAERLGIAVREGVRWGCRARRTTPAEIYVPRLGADAVGMSTVPEVIAANRWACECWESVVSPTWRRVVLDQPHRHQEVLDTTERVKDQFTRLVDRIIAEVRRERRAGPRGYRRLGTRVRPVFPFPGRGGAAGRIGRHLRRLPGERLLRPDRVRRAGGDLEGDQQGERRFQAICVVADTAESTPPCGLAGRSSGSSAATSP